MEKHLSVKKEVFHETIEFKQDENNIDKWQIIGEFLNDKGRKMSLSGEITDYHDIKFTLKDELEDEKDKIFEGRIDDYHVHMHGTWKYEDSDTEKHFEFDLSGKIKGKMKLDFRDWPKIEERIELDLRTMMIKKIPEEESNATEQEK